METDMHDTKDIRVRLPRGAVPAAQAPEPITPLAAIAEKFTIDDIAFAVREGLILYEAAGALFASRSDLALFADLRRPPAGVGELTK
jgi:hypothetical protein